MGMGMGMGLGMGLGMEMKHGNCCRKRKLKLKALKNRRRTKWTEKRSEGGSASGVFGKGRLEMEEPLELEVEDEQCC
ncbi:GL22872 [Drosophila persimilis]|uniref:GL22872 n=1 Tax=Drosophila persimilis TaxID=7234 RepID=B4GZX4_DROPE|nr:GL22872 [Drosophila persimilis]